LLILVDISNKASLNHLVKDNLQRHHDLSVKGNAKASAVLDDDDFICNRQFCSFCLKTQYEANFIECCGDKSWICPFCQGVCFCTRCLRQDTMTQLKAYFIALGGDLAGLLSGSQSIFDRMIMQNFNTHLELTLLTNADLINKYPHYKQVMARFMSRLGFSSLSLSLPLANRSTDLTLRYSNAVDD
jgi:hypothetical protein